MSWQDPFGDELRKLSRFAADIDRLVGDSLQPLAAAADAWHNALSSLPVEGLMASVQRAAEAAQQAFRRSLPPNWRDLDVEEWEDAMTLGIEHGINVLWAPRDEIIRLLIEAADDGQRADILVERQDEILEDVDLVLAGVLHPDLGHLPELARKATAAHGQGHHEAGQALAAAVVTGVVQESLGFERLAAARETFHESDPMENAWSLFSTNTVLHTVGRALHRTDVAPPGFNRHGSLHALPSQFTRANATTAVLLVAGLLGELQALLTERDLDDAEAA